MIYKEISCFNCESTAKYKCPICRMPYCSVNCCQEHKKSNCKRPDQINTTFKEEPNHLKRDSYLSSDSLPVETLEKLRQSSSLKLCLQNPHVRHIMSVISKSQKQIDLIAQAMHEPIFVEFATECLKVVQPPDQS